jgi:hypothetical protein
LRDAHHYLSVRGRKAAPDISVETGSYEHAGLVVDAVMDSGDFEQEAFEFEAGGWGIDTAAPEIPHRPGEPAARGPAPKGIIEPAKIMKKLDDLLWENDNVFDYLWFSSKAAAEGKRVKRAASALLDVLTAEAAVAGVNLDALSNIVKPGRSTVYKMAERGREALARERKVGHEATKGEENESDMTTVQLEAVRRENREEHEKTRALIQEEMHDVFRVLATFRETPAEEWASHLEGRVHNAVVVDISDRRKTA